MKLNDVEDPAAVLAIPEEADVEMIWGILEHSYDGIADDYERLESDEMPEWLMRRGSLCQELFAQLNDQR